MVLPKRTIDELITRYMLEPQLHDLFVEGKYDKSFYEWFFKALDCELVSVFEIDTVDIDDALLRQLGLNWGNRSEVIALATSFEQAFSDGVPYLRCVVDSDFDFLLGSRVAATYLLYTDYTSIELYCCCENVIDKVFSTGLGQVLSDAKILFEDFSLICQAAFIMRAANQSLGWRMQWRELRRSLSMSDEHVILDEVRLVRRYLSSNQRAGSLEEFNRARSELSALQVDDVRKAIHCEDFFDVLGWYIIQKIGRRSTGIGNPDSVRAMVLPALEMEQIRDEPLFTSLAQIYCNG